MLAQKYNIVPYDIVHVSVGDLLRAEKNKLGGKDDTEIQKHMQEGSLVPTEMVEKVLANFLITKVSQGKTLFVIDGFPRSMEQAKAFENHVSKLLLQ